MNITGEEDRIDRESFGRALKTEKFGRNLIYYEQIDSTNAEVKRLLKGDGRTEGTHREAWHGSLVLAEEQTRGRGRLGREWSSPKEGGIWMSFLIEPRLPAESCPMLTLVAAMAVRAAIKEITGLEAAIKWPNDIVIEGRKVCGILTEMAGMSEGFPEIILGIGINGNRRAFPAELKEVATSLALEKGRDIDRGLLIAEVCNSLEKYFLIFEKAGDLAPLKAEYEEYLVNRGRLVRILAEGEEYTGTALGINEQGALLVEREDKSIDTIISGEVSVRGVLGYT